MSTTTLKRIKIKKPAAHDSAGYGNEPQWDASVMSMPLPEYIKQTMQAVNWYYQFYTKTEAHEWFVIWYQHHFPKRVDDIKFINAAKSNTFSNVTAYAYIMELAGWKARYPILKTISKNIKEIIECGKARKHGGSDKEATDKKETPLITIQERVLNQAVAINTEIELIIDSYITNPDAFDPKAVKLISILRNKDTKPAHARHIKSFHAKMVEEFASLQQKGCDEQLSDSYGIYGKRNIRKMADFLANVMTACDQIIGEAKLTRPAKVKPLEDFVKGMKFKASDDKLGITSIPATQIIGASGCVIYNTRTRKIGYLIAKNTDGLHVKGASIIEYTEKSSQKTLRKPDEQIKEFKEQNTKTRFETWFTKQITTTETLLNGRLSPDIMILKAFK